MDYHQIKALKASSNLLPPTATQENPKSQTQVYPFASKQTTPDGKFIPRSANVTISQKSVIMHKLPYVIQETQNSDDEDSKEIAHTLVTIEFFNRSKKHLLIIKNAGGHPTHQKFSDYNFMNTENKPELFTSSGIADFIGMGSKKYNFQTISELLSKCQIDVYQLPVGGVVGLQSSLLDEWIILSLAQNLSESSEFEDHSKSTKYAGTSGPVAGYNKDYLAYMADIYSDPAGELSIYDSAIAVYRPIGLFKNLLPITPTDKMPPKIL